jgi:hypothetical protein
MVVAVTAKNTGTKPIEVSESSSFTTSSDLHPPLTVELRGANSKVLRTECNDGMFWLPDVGGPAVEAPTWTLKPGDVRRWLVDLSAVVERLKPPPGKYDLRVALWDKGRWMAWVPPPAVPAGQSDYVPLTVRSLRESDIGLLRKTVRPGSEKYICDSLYWDRMAAAPKLREALKPLEPDAYNAVLWPLLVRDICEAPTVAQISLEWYEKELAEVFAPELQLFAYEVALSRQTSSEAAGLERSISAKYPELKCYLEDIKHGRGPLVSIRQRRSSLLK